jgi:hypothetical protein
MDRYALDCMLTTADICLPKYMARSISDSSGYTLTMRARA